MVELFEESLCYGNKAVYVCLFVSFVRGYDFTNPKAYFEIESCCIKLAFIKKRQIEIRIKYKVMYVSVGSKYVINDFGFVPHSKFLYNEIITDITKYFR